MIVISDTTAITNLYQIGRLQLLIDVFGEIIIPHAVELELAEVPNQVKSIADLNFIKVLTPNDILTVSHLKKSLDDGEAEAIALAIEINADFLIIDEWKGRRIAKQLGLQVVGLLGILLTAKRKGIIPEIKPILMDLITNVNFRLHPDIIKNVLHEAGEI